MGRPEEAERICTSRTKDIMVLVDQGYHGPGQNWRMGKRTVRFHMLKTSQDKRIR